MKSRFIKLVDIFNTLNDNDTLKTFRTQHLPAPFPEPFRPFVKGGTHVIQPYIPPSRTSYIDRVNITEFT